MISLSITEAETADMLSVSCATLRKWRNQNQGPRWAKEGVTIHYTREAIAEFLRSRGPEKIISAHQQRLSREFPWRAEASPNDIRIIDIVGNSPLLLPDYAAARLLGLPTKVFLTILADGIGPAKKPQKIDGYYLFLTYLFYDDWRRWFLEQATIDDYSRIAELIKDHDRLTGGFRYCQYYDLDVR